ncbi:MAG: NUDIX hydrolase [Calditrichaeota bacterium]|nr:MAG: NUDIX hydrolase [Calditrichota bacterium]
MSHKKPSAFNCRVYGILTQKNQILISREKYDEIEIMKFPGGGIELGESPEEALIREFAEEANAKIRIDEFINVSKKFHKSVFNGTQLIALYWKVSLLEDEKITTHKELIPTGEKPNSFYQLFWANIFDLNEDFFTFATEKETFKKFKQSYSK